jgi:hypothetical protein
MTIESYSHWLKRQDFTLTNAQLKKIEKEILDEVRLLKDLSVSDQLLYLKKSEVKNFLTRYKEKNLSGHIHFAERMIWRPKGKADFRFIQPELVLTRNEFTVDAYDIWGQKREKTFEPNDDYKTHWDILRTLVSRAPNNSSVGVNLAYLVIDKVTKQYLGIIRLSSAAFRITSIFKDLGLTKDIQKEKNSKLNCVANGQTIVPTQPFGSAFLGGKLLSLLCLSKQVADDWEENNGFKLASVHTTSLYGTETGTQYSGLTGYWNELPENSKGEAVVELSEDTYEHLKEYLRHIDPQKYWQLFHEKVDTGFNKVREVKGTALKSVYRRLGLSVTDYTNHAPRGVYSSHLYKNTREYLRGEINESQLIPNFDNSIEALTDYWRYGEMGDTSSLVTSAYLNRLKKSTTDLSPTIALGRVNKSTAIDYVSQLKEKDANFIPAKETKIELRNPEKKEGYRKRKKQLGMVKGRIDFKNQPLPTNIDWYLKLPTMTWDEIQTIYGNQFSENKTD